MVNTNHQPVPDVGRKERKVILHLLLSLIVGMGLVLSSCKTATEEPAPPGAEKWEVIIIGAGAGGLAAGSTLSQAGVKPLILEQHDKPGGYMTTFERGDYRFEVSLHMMDGLDESGLTRSLFQKLGIFDRVKIVKFDPLYRSVHPDLTIDVPADLNDYLEILRQTFPHEAEGITNLFQDFMGMGDDIAGLNELMNTPAPLRWLMYPLVPFRHWEFVKNRNASLEDIIQKHISDPRAISVITQIACFMGIPPSRSPAALSAVMLESYHRHGTYHFLGGSQAVSDALVEVIKENGGEVRLNTRVDKILIHDGKAVGVRTKGGKEIYADYVISNANGYDTYFKLVGEEHLKPKYIEYVKGLEPGLSVTEVFLGVDLDLKKIGLGDIGEIFYTPSYDAAAVWESIYTMDIEKMSMVISLFSNSDPASAPPGKAVVILCTAGIYDWENRWRIDQGDDAYHKLKEQVGDRMIRVAEKMIPGLSGAIEEIEIATPITCERYTSNYKGSIIGWAPTAEQSMLNRMKQKSPIDHLYLAGAWTFPMGGQSACLMSGNLAAKEILARIR